MANDPEPSGEWEFYPVDDAEKPASVLLDLALIDEAPLAGKPHLLTIVVDFHTPGPKGTGTADEADQLRELEAALTGALAATGAIFVGHIRAAGQWQMFFYGNSAAAMRHAAAQVLSADPAWRWEIDDRDDPAWEAYHEDLYPDPERLQWIHNRKVIEALVEVGDPLVLPRRVDHYVYFSDPQSRQRFVDRALARGFAVEGVGFDEEQESPFSAQVYRNDPVDLDAVHALVMDLVGEAENAGGSYDGWETVVLDRPRGQSVGPN